MDWKETTVEIFAFIVMIILGIFLWIKYQQRDFFTIWITAGIFLGVLILSFIILKFFEKKETKKIIEEIKKEPIPKVNKVKIKFK